jgi:hypothetical protein
LTGTLATVLTFPAGLFPAPLILPDVSSGYGELLGLNAEAYIELVLAPLLSCISLPVVLSVIMLDAL